MKYKIFLKVTFFFEREKFNPPQYRGFFSSNISVLCERRLTFDRGLWQRRGTVGTAELYRL